VPTLSVIVPALNEEEGIERTLCEARRVFGDDAELIVVDGGSDDHTCARARRHAKVVLGTRGRGSQLNDGARRASGETLVFLHADTWPEPGCRRRIDRALEAPEVVGGCLRFAFQPSAPRWSRYHFLETCVNLRTWVFRTATGDQVIFARRSAFEEAGGFPTIDLFEDVEFVRALRRRGRFVFLASRAHTSRRRWDRHGFWRTVALHLLLRAAHAVRLSPNRLAAWYDAERSA